MSVVSSLCVGFGVGQSLFAAAYYRRRQEHISEPAEFAAVYKADAGLGDFTFKNTFVARMAEQAQVHGTTLIDYSHFGRTGAHGSVVLDHKTHPR